MTTAYVPRVIAPLILLLPLLVACDQLQERMGIPVAAKLEAEGKAIGSACRHAGRGLEDCYRLNPEADKAAVHTGWREMNEYMIKNNMQSLAPQFPAEPPAKPGAKKTVPKGEDHGDDDEDAKGAKHGEDAAKDGHADKDAKSDAAKTKDGKAKDDGHSSEKGAAGDKPKKAGDEKKAGH